MFGASIYRRFCSVVIIWCSPWITFKVRGEARHPFLLFFPLEKWFHSFVKYCQTGYAWIWKLNYVWNHELYVKTNFLRINKWISLNIECPVGCGLISLFIWLHCHLGSLIVYKSFILCMWRIILFCRDWTGTNAAGWMDGWAAPLCRWRLDRCEMVWGREGQLLCGA